MTLKSNKPNLDCFKNPDISLHRLSRVLSFSALTKSTVSVCTNTAFSSRAFHWLGCCLHSQATLLFSSWAFMCISLTHIFFHLLVGVFRPTEDSKFCFPWEKLKLEKNSRASPNMNHIDQLTAASAKSRWRFCWGLFAVLAFPWSSLSRCLGSDSASWFSPCEFILWAQHQLCG